MSGAMSGSGIGLVFPQNLYPSELNNVPYDLGNAFQTIAPGAVMVVPRGDWLIEVGPYSHLQWKDPITTIWRNHNTARRGLHHIVSDGGNIRVANMTGCPVAGVITNAGSGAVQGTASITPSTGNSTWLAIVGGRLTAVSTISAAGSNFTVQPLVFIPDPPSPGVQATAYAVLTNGSVSAVTILNGGAGYTGSTITGLIFPNPTDPNINTITNGTVVFTVGAAGSLTAALCTNPGQPIAAASLTTMSLSITGAGAAAVTPQIIQTITSVTIGGGGTGFGNALVSGITTSGGGATGTDATNNPIISLTGFIPRPAQIWATSNAGGTLVSTVINDGGLFLSAPQALVTSATGIAPTAAATLTLGMGTANDGWNIQPLRN